MLYKSLSMIFSFIFYCSLQAAASSTYSKPMQDTRAMPYEGIVTPYYAQHENFLNAIRTGDVESTRSLLHNEPTLVTTRYNGSLTPFHILAAVEHFNPAYNPEPIFDLFIKAAHTLHRSTAHNALLLEKANVNDPAFMLLCTGRPLLHSAVTQLMMTPAQVALCYQNTKTLAAFLKLQHLTLHRAILADPRFNECFDLYRQIVRYTPIPRGEQKIWQQHHCHNDVDNIAHIAAIVLKRFGSKGFEMLQQEDFDVCLINTAKRIYSLCLDYDDNIVLEPFIQEAIRIKEAAIQAKKDEALAEPKMQGYGLLSAAYNYFTSKLSSIPSESLSDDEV